MIGFVVMTAITITTMWTGLLITTAIQTCRHDSSAEDLWRATVYGTGAYALAMFALGAALYEATS